MIIEELDVGGVVVEEKEVKLREACLNVDKESGNDAAVDHESKVGNQLVVEEKGEVKPFEAGDVCDKEYGANAAVEESKAGRKEEVKVCELGVSATVDTESDSNAAVHKVNDDVFVSDAKRVMVGAGARVLFYPTLLYNVVRHKVQAEFHWWDWVDEFVLLGAVPFTTDVPRLKELGVNAVITLNEPYETLVPSSLYHAHGIDHLVIPTRDYCYAPSLVDICGAVEFIHEHVLVGQSTYVHCKAGRGRSTTIVLCYLVRHKDMTPIAAYDYVRSVRPRVHLACAQWQAVEEYYYYLRVKSGGLCLNLTCLSPKLMHPAFSQDLVAFDDSSVVVVTKADLDGYNPSNDELVPVEGALWADLSVIYHVRAAGQAALARISCLWLRCHTAHSNQKILDGELSRKSSCSITADHVGSISVDIHVY